MFRRVRVRITLLAVSLLLILYCISSIAIFTIVQKVVMHDINTELLNLSQTALLEGPNFAELQLPFGVYGIFNYDSVIHPSPYIPQALEAKLLNLINTHRQSRWMLNVSAEGASFRVLYIPRASVSSTSLPDFLILAKNDTSEVMVLSRLEWTLEVVGLFGLLGTAVSGFFLAERVLRPIHTAWQRQLEFVSNASHELRTPLAVIQSNLGIVMEHTDQGVLDNLEWLNNAHSESRRLTKLVQDLLTLARSDSEKAPLALEAVDLSALTNRVRDLYETIAELGGVRLTIEPADCVCVNGDGDRLHQLLVILLDNAMKFTPSGGSIVIRLKKSRSTAILEIVDSGKGIDANELPRVFERFYTGDEARARANKVGTGLGLSIAQWIVEAHHGKIGVQSKGLGHGTTVRVELPNILQ